MDATDRRKRASEEAAAWWVRLKSEVEPARIDREEFVDWLRESAIHVAEMLRIAKVHDSLTQFKSWAKVDTEGADSDEENVVALPAHHMPVAQVRAKQPMRIWVGLLAASLAVVAITSLWVVKGVQTIETERGERREVALSDGSVLEVDPKTTLRVAYEPATRDIILERGRVLFRVAKNPARPFLVHVGGTTVRAVGTAFGVERQDEAIVVTVSEGKVGVYSSEASSLQEDINASHNSADTAADQATQKRPTNIAEILLTPGQQLKLKASGDAEPVRNVDSERELQWAKGRLVFDDETVSAAVAEFNRYNRVQLRVADDTLGSRPVGGVFDAADPESFIAFLQTVTSVKVTRTATEIIMQ